MGFVAITVTLKGQCHMNFVLTETGGFRLGPPDVPHALLTSVFCPFNLLRSFKDDFRRNKTDFIIMKDTHACHASVKSR